MIRALVRSVIQNATVTHADTTWPAALRIDPLLMRAAELLPFEQVEVVNLATGERVTTWVEAADEGSGEVRLHSGVRHPARQGDIITIVAFGDLHEGQTLAHKARVVTLDANNQLVSVGEG